MPYRVRNVTVRTPYGSPIASTNNLRYFKEQRGFYADGKEVTTYYGMESRSRTLPYQLPNGNWTAVSAAHRLISGIERQALLNRAYNRFRDKAIGETAELGVLAGEFRTSWQMIALRGGQLRRAYQKARRFDVPGLCSEIRAAVLPKHRGKNRREIARSYGNQASGLWLEYSFGWSPMLSDVYSATQVISKPTFPVGRYRGSASGSFYEDDHEAQSRYTKRRGKIRYNVYGNVRISNPNAFLLNQLGLTNPVAVAWELVPFSFIADWFFDISTFINSATDFVGTSVEQAGWSKHIKGEVIHEIARGSRPAFHFDQVFLGRNPGLPRPVPNANIFLNVGSSRRRAANAVSLLTQVLTGR